MKKTNLNQHKACLARDKADGESVVLAKIAEMPEQIVPWVSGSMLSSKPGRQPYRRLWYGMPAHAKDGKVV